MADNGSYVVGLTGGIGSGKSAVAREFGQLGVPVIDADQAARTVVAPGSSALAEISDTLGTGILNAEGALDRRKLREKIFADQHLRSWLENLLHPEIGAELQRLLANVDAPYALLVIPLLLESGRREMADRVLVVDVPEEMQLQRAARRDRVSIEQVRPILQAQIGRAVRLQAADDILDNSGDLQDLCRRVSELHALYSRLSTAD